MDGELDRWIGKQVDRWNAESMDGWVDGWIKRQIDRQACRQVEYLGRSADSQNTKCQGTSKEGIPNARRHILMLWADPVPVQHRIRIREIRASCKLIDV